MYCKSTLDTEQYNKLNKKIIDFVRQYHTKQPFTAGNIDPEKYSFDNIDATKLKTYNVRIIVNILCFNLMIFVNISIKLLIKIV